MSDRGHLSTAAGVSFEERASMDAFARRAALRFSESPGMWTFEDPEIDPALLAIRWGLEAQAVLVCRLDETHRPLIYRDCVPPLRHVARDSPFLRWEFYLQPTYKQKAASTGCDLPPMQRRVLEEVGLAVTGILSEVLTAMGCTMDCAHRSSVEAATAARQVVGGRLGLRPLEAPQAVPPTRLFEYGAGGALLCREEIPGVTQPVEPDVMKYYQPLGDGGPLHFVAESMNRTTARAVAASLGGVLVDELKDIARRAGVGLLALPPMTTPEGVTGAG